ncbi:MAG: response regulator [Chloroflexi bacterium]|nr:response regulator [Chloroflexota bacterium]
MAASLSLDFKGLRILGIDDNATNRKVLTKMVEGFGCRIETASSGAKGLEMLRKAHQTGDPYRIVLLDMQMPGMDGEQTAFAIKNDPLVKDVKIIVLTSMGQRGDAVRLEALGCAAYLLKPVKQSLLYETLRTILGYQSSEKLPLVTQHQISEKHRQGLGILLAEDNLINQKLAIILLQKAGYSVDAVGNGLQALEKAKTEKYSVILMDVQMPDMDGFEATRQIREWEAGQARHIPIIAMTAHALKGDRELCIEAGMDDYVTKPLDSKALFAAIDHWIQTDGRNGTLPGQENDLQDYSGLTSQFSVKGEMDYDDGLFGEAPDTEIVQEVKPEASPIVFYGDEEPLDFTSAMPRFFNDRNFFIEMCQDLVSHMPERLQEINQALRENNGITLSRHAHNLKGVSSNFSAGPVSKIAAQIEALTKSEDMSKAELLVQQLEFESERLCQYCYKEFGVK